MMTYILDISGHNGEVDFEKVKASGIDGVMLKCTEGDSYLAPKFRPNYEKALAAGLKVGAYHFLRAAKVLDAIKEGKWFGQCCEGLTLELGMALDIEHEGVNWDAAKLSTGDAYNVVNLFAQNAAKYGREELYQEKKLLIYSTKDYFNRFLAHDSLEVYPKWLANPDKIAFDRNVKMVQYSWSGLVEGVEKPVDLNALLETSQILDMALLKQAPHSFAVPEKVEPAPLWHIVGNIGCQPLDLKIYKE